MSEQINDVNGEPQAERFDIEQMLEVHHVLATYREQISEVMTVDEAREFILSKVSFQFTGHERALKSIAAKMKPPIIFKVRRQTSDGAGEEKRRRENVRATNARIDELSKWVGEIEQATRIAVDGLDERVKGMQKQLNQLLDQFQPAFKLVESLQRDMKEYKAVTERFHTLDNNIAELRKTMALVTMNKEVLPSALPKLIPDKR